jgi:hypothetical protein
MNTTITRRTYLYLAAATAAALLVVLALVLALRARGDHQQITRLVNDDLVLASSVSDARLLTAQLRLSVTQAVLNPADPAPAARFRSGQARLKDELRRARLHARDNNTADVVDDLDNRALALGATADKVFTAVAAGRTDEARAALATLEQDSSEVSALAEELYTVATASAEQHGHALSGSLRSVGLLALALGALVLAAQSGALAWAESGSAIVAAFALLLPYSVVQRLVKDADSGYASMTPSSSEEVADGEEGEVSHFWSETDGEGGSWAGSDEAGAAPPALRLVPSDIEANAAALLEEMGAQPPRSISFDDAERGEMPPEPEEEPEPVWKPKSMQRPKTESAA